MFITYVKGRGKYIVGVGATEEESVSDVTCFATQWEKLVTVRYPNAPKKVQTKALKKLDMKRLFY